ncbi:pyrroline-5-carboxylate reductase 3-like [Dermatophagoides pteronyssinus]|uniref:Pyrroline-5-carboxylate reductase n=1 Tax=Dermatophagoides pteronyssinus TaxID=6956 RepID=A0ABQ8JWR7_DERPT|nr:hypothetical protein DERP_014322 [Dermatophagoides pteronyssinus]
MSEKSISNKPDDENDPSSTQVSPQSEMGEKSLAQKSEKSSTDQKKDDEEGGGGGGGGGGNASPSLEQQQPPENNEQSTTATNDDKHQASTLESESQKDINDDIGADEKSDAEEKETVPQKKDEKQKSSKKSAKSSVKESSGKGMTKRRKGEKLTKQNCRIGFVGAGKMTEMIIKGLLEYAGITAKQIFVASKSGKNHDHYKQLGCSVTKRSYDIFGKMDCDVVFLAIHGYVIRQCYQHGGIRPLALTTNFIPNQRHPIYILSLVGGIPINDIKKTLLNPDHPDKYQIEMHRIILNHSVGYGQGIGSLDVDLDSKNCAQIIRELLTPLARFEHTPENQMDIACALVGCGSAFCYYFLSAISDGAFKKGLNKAKAIKIAADALRSASVSLLVSGKNPSDLRDTYASPSGPAIYGIYVLDKDDFPSGISSAVDSAYKRIKELADKPVTS